MQSVPASYEDGRLDFKLHKLLKPPHSNISVQCSPYSKNILKPCFVAKYRAQENLQECCT